MRDLDGAVMRREQPVVRQALDDRGEHRVTLQIQLRERNHPPREHPLLPGARQAHEEPAGSGALVVGEVFVRAVSQTRDRAADAAQACERLELEPAVAAGHPQLDQRGREQRQPARLVADLCHESLAERRLDPDSDSPGGQLHSAPELIGGHRADQHQVGGEQLGELGIRRTLAREVGPQGEDDDSSFRIAGRGDDPLDEPTALILVRTRREELLELVDDQDEPLVHPRV